MNDRTLPHCPADTALRVIDGRWKLLILMELLTGVKRFNQLGHALNITPKVLARQLKQLEQDGIIERRVYPQIPPKVEYSITPLGKSLESVLYELHCWGVSYLQHHV